MKHVLTLDFHESDPDSDAVNFEFDRIAGMIAEGYTSGELLGEDDDGERTYRGWWSLETA